MKTGYLVLAVLLLGMFFGMGYKAGSFTAEWGTGNTIKYDASKETLHQKYLRGLMGDERNIHRVLSIMRGDCQERGYEWMQWSENTIHDEYSCCKIEGECLVLKHNLWEGS